MIHRHAGERRIHQAHPIVVVILVTCVAATLAACGTVSGAGSAGTTSAEHRDGAAPTPEDIAEHARTLPGVDDVDLVYVDPDGAEHDAAPDGATDRADWTALIYIAHDLRRSTGWTAKTVGGLVGDRPSSSPRLEIRLTPTANGSSTLDKVAAGPPYVVPKQWPDDPAAPDCSSDDLLLTIAGHDEATGHRAMLVAATNISDAPCAVKGYPELAFRTLDERAIDATVTHGSSFVAQDPGAERVVVPAEAQVSAVAGWDAMSTAEDPAENRPDVPAEILLAVGPDAEPVVLPLTSWVFTSEQGQATDLGNWQPITPLDVLDGAEVEVTAWAPVDVPF